MPKFRQWMRNKFSNIKNSSKAEDAQLPPNLPVLPQRRQNNLTPVPSRENLVQGLSTQSAFFEKLPPEVRQQIYIHAFGGRTIHIDLSFDHPRLPGPKHAGLDPDDLRDRTVSPAWLWFSSVCHRNPWLTASEDGCQCSGFSASCYLFPGSMPEKCFIGVMGWLLTCRQA